MNDMYNEYSELPNDKGGFGWGLLGCCIPIAGLILWLVWRDERPRTAKALIIGAAISTLSSIILQLSMCGIGAVAGLA